MGRCSLCASNKVTRHLSALCFQVRPSRLRIAQWRLPRFPMTAWSHRTRKLIHGDTSPLRRDYSEPLEGFPQANQQRHGIHAEVLPLAPLLSPNKTARQRIGEGPHPHIFLLPHGEAALPPSANTLGLRVTHRSDRYHRVCSNTNYGTKSNMKSHIAAGDQR